MAKISIGLQLYTVREDCDKDFRGTVKKVAEMGYQGVELAGDGGLSSSEMKALVEDCGLQVAGAHTGFDDLRNKLDETMQYNREIGNTRIICPYLPQEYQDKGKAGYLEAAEILGGVGEKVVRSGFSLSYHNHSFEFGQDGGQYFLDILLGAAGEKNLKSELDTYWVQHGGAVPADYVNKYAERIELLHIKDMADDEARSFAEIGAGILDWDAIFVAAEEADVAWYLVEQDVCQGPPMESARKSLEFLESRGMLD
jgi:sugar phosphate isomerase/epimerase